MGRNLLRVLVAVVSVSFPRKQVTFTEVITEGPGEEHPALPRIQELNEKEAK